MKKHIHYAWAAVWLGLQGFSVMAESPQRILVIGDSMMGVASHALENVLGKRSGVKVQSQVSLGSGLARLDAYDWMREIDRLVEEFKPEMSVVWFGTNDRQPMQTGAGIVNLSDPGWETEYARRVGMAMDKLTARKGAEVFWLELPMMRDNSITEKVNIINRIAKEEADKRPEVTFFQTRGALGRRPDEYTPNIIGPGGKLIVLRDRDGVHLNRPGADRIAAFIDQVIYE